MPERIFEFFLSHHFMMRGWDRSIDRFVLKRLLPDVNGSKTGRKIIVITPAYYQSKGIDVGKDRCLILILNRNTIATGYWSKNPNCLITKERDTELQLLFK